MTTYYTHLMDESKEKVPLNEETPMSEEELDEIINSETAIAWQGPTAPTRIRDGIKRARQVIFLKAFAELGVVSQACRVAGINQVTESTWRRGTDKWYVQQFKDAMQQYRDSIDQEVHNRAIHGVEVPIIGKVQGLRGPEDKIIGTKTIKSDLLLMFLAKRHIVEFRDKYEPPKEEGKPLESVSPMTRITIQLDMMGERRTGTAHISNTSGGALPAGDIIDVVPEVPEQAQLPESTE